MSASANILTKPELFDLYVRKFRSICDIHGVQFGSLENLRDFMPRLTDDKSLAMDFWAFIGKISRREEGELSDPQMLAVIVESIAGSDISDTDGELKTLVAELSVLVSGVDIESPSPGYVESAHLPPTKPDTQSSASEVTAQAGDEMPLRLSSSRAAFISDEVDREANPASRSPQTISSSPRVVFISDAVDRGASPAPSLPSRLLSSSRAVFISEGVDEELGPASSLRPRLSSPSRAVFIPDGVDAKTDTPSPTWHTPPSPPRAVFISESVDGEARLPRSSPSIPPPSPRAIFISEAVDREARVASPLPPALPSVHRVIRNSATTDSEAGPASSLPSTPSAQVVEALRWLQWNSLELKQHLDAIDKKMSRLEPHLDELASKGRSPKERTREPVEESVRPTVGQLAHQLVGKLRFVLQPYLSPDSGSLATASASKRDEWTPIPLGAYVQPRGLRGMPLFVSLTLVVVASVFLLQRYDLVPQDGTWREVYTALVQKVQGPPTRRVEASSASDEVVAGTEKAVAAVANVIDEVAGPPATPDKPSPSDSKFSGLQAAAMSFGSLSSGSAASSPGSARADNSAPAANRATAEDESLSDGAGPVNVSAAVMEGNLFLSRVPSYPRAAKAKHIEGPVVVQAIISPNGKVRDVQVIEGDPLLRSAAEEAIYKWRYRPYLLKGRPVEVATTITIDFKLKR